MLDLVRKLVAAATLCALATGGMSTQAEVVLGPRLAAAPPMPFGELLLSELNCTACHAGGESARRTARQAPVLGADGLHLTPQYLRKYLLDPAAAKPGGTMPDLLHALPAAEKAQAVEELVHYLVSQQAPTAKDGVSAEDFQIKHGQALYHSIGCVACHQPQISAETSGETAPPVDAALQRSASVPLVDLARKTTVDQLAKFLLDPLKARPSGRMPAFNLSSAEATSLAVYLLREQGAQSVDSAPVAGLKYQYYEGNFGGNPDLEAMPPKASGVAAGFDISARKREQSFGFRFTGSIEIPREGEYLFAVRSDDGSRLAIDGQVVVENWGDHAPEEKRGRIRLTAGQHGIVLSFYNNGAGHDLAVFWRGPGFGREPIPASVFSHIGRPMIPLGAEPFAVEPEKADRGRARFASLGCAACHTGQTDSTSSPAPSLDRLSVMAGCLAEAPTPRAAKFDLSTPQRNALRSTFRTGRSSPASPAEEIAHTMARMNCYACHTRDGLGGLSAERLAYFKVNGEADLGDEGRTPPHLTKVGGKLRKDWIDDVLHKAGRVRPYMATRMPQFGPATQSLPALFEQADVQAGKPTPAFGSREAKFGRRLAGTGGLVCISCHTLAQYKSLGIPAIDLAQMTKRLRYDWFHRYLLDPASLRPGTRMPSFWPNGEAANRDILGGDTEAQIGALWAYLESHPETDLPPGLIQGKKEIVAEKEPVIYRNFIAGAGSRAIGVGYPEKVNLAFDANGLRAALIWQGAFIDGSRHSSGRGEGFEPPLGNNIVRLPEGPAFAPLASADAPWPKPAPSQPGFRMRGYELDAHRRPTFLYEIHGLQIEDRFEPVPGELDAHFRRTIRLRGAPVENLWFRAAAGALEARPGGGVIDRKTELRFTGVEPVLREVDGQKELLAPVRFQNGEAVIQFEIIW